MNTSSNNEYYHKIFIIAEVMTVDVGGYQNSFMAALCPGSRIKEMHS